MFNCNVGSNPALAVAVSDIYSFDMKNDLTFKSYVRDVGTIIGQTYYGVGKGFPIYFQGTVRIPQR
jgi:hypothetical protein